MFVENRSQLSKIIKHIQLVGKFMCLVLNLDKTVAFDHKQLVLAHVIGVLIQNEPVKYLGIYVGLGDYPRRILRPSYKKQGEL